MEQFKDLAKYLAFQLGYPEEEIYKLIEQYLTGEETNGLQETGKTTK